MITDTELKPIIDREILIKELELLESDRYTQGFYNLCAQKSLPNSAEDLTIWRSMKLRQIFFNFFVRNLNDFVPYFAAKEFANPTQPEEAPETQVESPLGVKPYDRIFNKDKYLSSIIDQERLEYLSMILENQALTHFFEQTFR